MPAQLQGWSRTQFQDEHLAKAGENVRFASDARRTLDFEQLRERNSHTRAIVELCQTVARHDDLVVVSHKKAEREELAHKPQLGRRDPIRFAIQGVAPAHGVQDT